jgi:predicted aspartyl protease
LIIYKVIEKLNYNDYNNVKTYLQDNKIIKNYFHKEFLKMLYTRLTNNEEIEIIDEKFIIKNYNIYKYLIELNIDYSDNRLDLTIELNQM